MTLGGTAQNCQTLSKVTGGARGKARTNYITLLRIEDRQIRFKTSNPIAISDGDFVLASGPLRGGELKALALKNTVTNSVAHSGVFGRVVLAIVYPLFGIPFCLMASLVLGEYALWLYIAFLTASVWQIYQAIATRIALSAVKRAEEDLAFTRASVGTAD